MQAFKRVVEWYLGVPPSDPGQGTAWNYLWRTPWPGWLPSWSVLILLSILVLGLLDRSQLGGCAARGFLQVTDTPSSD